MKVVITLILSVFSFSAMAINQNACSKLLNNGMWKKYEYGGIDQPLTKATKRHGSSKGSSATSTEGTTALLDPKYYSNVSTSETQATSSTGECNLFGYRKLKEVRELYIGQNKDELLAQMAQGGGEHVRVLASFSLCDNEAFSQFGKEIQTLTPGFIAREKNYGELIDSMVMRSSLNSHCLHKF